MEYHTSFAIGNARIAPGARRTVDLPVSVLSDHTPVTMSAHVIHGRRPGPTVFVTAGVHGDEIIGVEIVRRLLGQPALAQLKGTLIAIPIVNTYGFLARSRYLPDRRDLNRSFPGSPTGSLAARLADLFLNEIVKRCDLGIDLHSAAIHRTNLPQVRVSPDNAETMRLAKLFGAPVVLTSKLREGSLRSVAKANGVDVLLYEAGEGLRFDETAVRCGVTGILRVLKDRGMISGAVGQVRGEPLICPSSRWLRSPQGGLLRTFKVEGDRVPAGEVLALVSDPFGEVTAEVVAPVAGIIVGRAVLPMVNEGDALFHLAQIAPAQGGAAAPAAEAETLADEDEII